MPWVAVDWGSGASWRAAGWREVEGGVAAERECRGRQRERNEIASGDDSFKIDSYPGAMRSTRCVCR